MKFGQENGHQQLMSVLSGQVDSMMPILLTSFLVNRFNALILICLQNIIQVLIEINLIQDRMDKEIRIKLVFIRENVMMILNIFQIIKLNRLDNVFYNLIISIIMQPFFGMQEQRFRLSGIILKLGIMVGLILRLFKINDLLIIRIKHLKE